LCKEESYSLYCEIIESLYHIIAAAFSFEDKQLEIFVTSQYEEFDGELTITQLMAKFKCEEVVSHCMKLKNLYSEMTKQ